MDFESCNSAAQFAIPQSQSTSVISNATPFIDFGLNMLATGHVEPTIRISDVTQPLNFAVFNRVQPYISKLLTFYKLFVYVYLLKSKNKKC